MVQINHSAFNSGNYYALWLLSRSAHSCMPNIQTGKIVTWQIIVYLTLDWCDNQQLPLHTATITRQNHHHRQRQQHHNHHQHHHTLPPLSPKQTPPCASDTSNFSHSEQSGSISVWFWNENAEQFLQRHYYKSYMCFSYEHIWLKLQFIITYIYIILSDWHLNSADRFPQSYGPFETIRTYKCYWFWKQILY